MAFIGLLVLAGCGVLAPIPDLSEAEAARLISGAPEFSQYARLVAVQRLHHSKDSMSDDTMGAFSFVYLHSSSDQSAIEAGVDFRYHEGRWYLNEFDYGCPRDCHFVEVYDGPEKHR
jgi:hypothetical protein